MRVLLIAALCFCAASAAARADPAEDLARASHMLAANWRPFQSAARGGSAEAAFSAACAGVLDEMTWLDGRLPETMNPEALRTIRTPHGLVLIPTDENPATFFLFAATDMQGLTSGLATIRVVNAALGHVDLADAGGTQLALQLGTAGRHALLRIFREENEAPLLFVACASTSSD
jgi:hypothetical protein